MLSLTAWLLALSDVYYYIIIIIIIIIITVIIINISQNTHKLFTEMCFKIELQ